MSLYGSRWLSVTPLAGVERQGRGSVGGGGAEEGLLFPSCRRLYCLQNPSLFCRMCLLWAFSRLFVVMKASGLWGPVSLVYPQPESPQDSLQGGDSSICASVCAERRLNGLHRLEGRLLASSNTSGQSQVSQFCRFESSFSIKSSLFWSPTAPQFFTWVMAPVSDILHPLGICMCRYLDDWLNQPPSRSLVLQALETGVHLCQDLSVVITWEKYNLLPLQRVVYLEVTLDATLFKASPSQPRVEKLCLIAEAFLSCSIQPVSLWRRLLGVLSSLTPLFPGGRLWIRSLQLRLHRLWDQKDNSTLIA